MGLRGLEPRASCMSCRRSSQLSYRPDVISRLQYGKQDRFQPGGSRPARRGANEVGRRSASTPDRYLFVGIKPLESQLCDLRFI